jgi:high-affinity iron transporter
MMKVRSLIKNRENGAKVEAAVASANTTIHKANKLLNEQEYSFWFVLFLSGSIILREGLEALLIVIAILDVLRSVEAHEARKWVHAGWATAIVLGIVSWFFADHLVSMGMKSIEMIEGIGALVAVFILVYIGFWLHNKTHAANWKAFIDDKVKAKLNSNNMLGLAVVSFIVVFREAFETILFLTSLNLEVAPANKSGIGIGVGGAAILVLALGYVMTKYARKIPISKIFKMTSVAISILAVVLAGKGIHALQEGGIIPISSSLFSFRLSLIGFYPTLETIAAQSLVIALVIILWNWSNRSAKAASAS